MGERTLSVYGCSFTEGTGVADDEAFCSVLQGRLPKWRIENYGVGSYGQTQNLIELERNLRWQVPDIVTFCWIPHHLLRNAADVTFIARRFAGSSASPITIWPRAMLDTEGKLQIKPVSFRRPDLAGINLDDFTPDPFYLDLVCFSLFQKAAEKVTEKGGNFFVTVLSGAFSRHLTGRLKNAGISVLDISLDGPEYIIPDDPHPNALAHRIHAERIHRYLEDRGWCKAPAPVSGLLHL